MENNFNYTTIEDLVSFLNNYGKFNQAAACRRWGLGSRTLYNIMHGESGSITYSNYVKLISLCNELMKMKLEEGE